MHGDELNTWQEIAEFLGISIRTAQNYERTAGLPVHRLPGERSRVWAYREELEKWKMHWPTVAAGAAVEPATHAAEPPDNSRRTRRFLLPGLAVLALAILAFGFLRFRRRASMDPATFSVRGRDLVVADTHGRELWRYTFPASLLENVYHDSTELPRVCNFVDLDGDGHSEVLFRYQPVDFGTRWACRSIASRIPAI